MCMLKKLFRNLLPFRDDLVRSSESMSVKKFVSEMESELMDILAGAHAKLLRPWRLPVA